MTAKLSMLVLLIGALGILSARPVRSEECPTASRSEQFQHFVAYKVLADAAESTLLGNSGESPDARPTVHESIGDMRRQSEELLGSIQLSSPFRLPGLTYFAVMDQKLRSADDEVIGVPHNMLWCFVHEGDLVLLSDHTTPHYTRVYRVDRTGKRIFFTDQSPEQMFILEGRNTLGLHGQLDFPDLHQTYRQVLQFNFPGFDQKTADAFHQNLANWALVGILGGRGPRVVGITQSEFQAVATGVVTLDSFEGIQTSIAPMIDGRARSSALMAAARVALRQERPLHQAGAEIASRSLNAALATQDQSLAVRARGLLLLSWTLDRYAAVEAGNDKRATTLASSIKTLSRSTPIATLIGTWAPRDSSRAGNAAERSGDLAGAVAYFNEVISHNPAFEEAWLGRATAKVRQSDAEGAYNDATRALALNETAAKSVEDRRTRRHPKDADGVRFDDRELARLKDNRLAARRIRVGASMLTNNCAQIQNDARELISAKSPEGFAALANCESLASGTRSSRQIGEQTIKLEPNEKVREVYLAKPSHISVRASVTQ
jgi:tetratricopeptide (TPR) repeat protein